MTEKVSSSDTVYEKIMKFAGILTNEEAEIIKKEIYFERKHIKNG